MGGVPGRILNEDTCLTEEKGGGGGNSRGVSKGVPDFLAKYLASPYGSAALRSARSDDSLVIMAGMTALKKRAGVLETSGPLDPGCVLGAGGCLRAPPVVGDCQGCFPASSTFTSPRASAHMCVWRRREGGECVRARRYTDTQTHRHTDTQTYTERPKARTLLGRGEQSPDTLVFPATRSL